ncbi:hypothetical protein LOK49_LG07G01283 [Camellia lanceoleosa]|uniref:Uncharacterized protein n=1 Tax=Camellia lanceoleosa TaxID=1840588 RepID=A0ACC0H839_9ERIC|nr:hypothetical protein LOK49_LG07G01283 [Camellia lanceoleosa]
MLALTVLITLWWSSPGKFMPIDTTVAQDGSGNFTRIADAILAAPNYSKRGYYIKIKEGFYREHFRWKTKNKSYICWGWLEQDADIRQQEQWWRFPTLGVNYIIKVALHDDCS